MLILICMKIIPFILVLFLWLPSEPVKLEPVGPNHFDNDFFKRELQNAVLEFAKDLDMDPDSIYVPFRDEL